MPGFPISQKFGYDISVINKGNFEDYKFEIIQNEFKKDILDILLFRKNEEDYLDLNYYLKKYGKTERLNKLFNEIRGDLERLGWKTCLSFGDTGLFIYEGEKPKNCW